MKSSLLIKTRSRQVTILSSICLLIGISFACTASKSAGSPANANSNTPGSQPSTLTTPATDATSQEKAPPCTLTRSGAPALKGLKLGMTKEEVLALFPGSKDNAEVKSSLDRPANKTGTSDLLIRPAEYQSRESFAGIKQVTAGFLDGKLYTLNLNYDGPEFPQVDKFVARVVEGTNLPPADQWEPYPGLDQMKSLKCNGFEVHAFIGGPGGS